MDFELEIKKEKRSCFLIKTFIILTIVFNLSCILRYHDFTTFMYVVLCFVNVCSYRSIKKSSEARIEFLQSYTHYFNLLNEYEESKKRKYEWKNIGF